LSALCFASTDTSSSLGSALMLAIYPGLPLNRKLIEGTALLATEAVTD
jgi:hypothetical protein